MLRDRQRAERAVERPPRDRDEALPDQVLQVQQPDPGHLVHRDQRALVGVVQAPDAGVVGGQAPDFELPLRQIRAPQLQRSAPRCSATKLTSRLAFGAAPSPALFPLKQGTPYSNRL